MLKVLIVENEYYVRRGIVLTVNWTAMGCLIIGEASNGEEGLEAARKYRPDIILTDIKMPRMDGIEMLHRLREEGNEAYVIMLSAYSDFEYIQSALRLRATDYLLKPFHDNELERVIRSIRDRIDAQSASPAHDAFLRLKKGDKSKYVMEAMSYITENYADNSLSVSAIAQSIGVSEGHLSHVFKKETDYTMLEYISQYRIHMAMKLLKDCRAKVYEIANRVGYKDITYFSSTFKKMVGVTPSEYQDRCR